jgi:ATP synthase F subunit
MVMVREMDAEVGFAVVVVLLRWDLDLIARPCTKTRGFRSRGSRGERERERGVLHLIHHYHHSPYQHQAAHINQNNPPSTAAPDQTAARMAGVMGRDLEGALVAVIADEDTITGFLLAGVGDVDIRKKSNFLVVDSKTTVRDVEASFKDFTSREDIAIVLISQPIANMIRHVVSTYNKVRVRMLAPVAPRLAAAN